MGKTSTRRKRGIQRGVGKYKIQSKIVEAEQVSNDGEGFLEFRRSAFITSGQKCFDILFRGIAFFQLAPFRCTLTGQYVPLNSKKTVRHYIALAIVVLFMLQKFVGTAQILLYEQLKVETFMCLSLFVIHFAAFMTSLGMWARPEQTLDLLNSWPKILACLEEIQGDGRHPTPFDNMSTSLKIIAPFLVCQGIALGTGVASLLFSNLPACFFPMAENFGLIPEGVLPRFGWQLVFFPLECLSYIPPMFAAPFSGAILVILMGVLKVYLDQVR